MWCKQVTDSAGIELSSTHSSEYSDSWFLRLIHRKKICNIFAQIVMLAKTSNNMMAMFPVLHRQIWEEKCFLWGGICWSQQQSCHGMSFSKRGSCFVEESAVFTLHNTHFNITAVAVSVAIIFFFDKAYTKMKFNTCYNPLHLSQFIWSRFHSKHQRICCPLKVYVGH